jgi:YggT family protein
MSTLLAAIGREEVADYVEALFLVYMVLIFIRVLLSWIPRIPYILWLRAVIRFIEETTDPYLNIFRRVIPPIGGRLDISPIIAIIVLVLAQGIVVGAIRG